MVLTLRCVVHSPFLQKLREGYAITARRVVLFRVSVVCLGVFLVCVGLPGNSLKHEDTAGRPRNDEDPAGWKCPYWFVVSVLQQDVHFCFFRGLRHCEVVMKVVVECLLPAEAI